MSKQRGQRDCLQPHNFDRHSLEPFASVFPFSCLAFVLGIMVFLVLSTYGLAASAAAWAYELAVLATFSA